MNDTQHTDDKVKNIIIDIQSGKFSSLGIRQKYNLTLYRFYKIMNEYELRTDNFRPGPKGPSGPKNTKFKQFLYGTKEDREMDKVFQENFNLSEFIMDVKNNIKIEDILNKYNITIFQFRELKKIHCPLKLHEEMEKIPSAFDLESFKIDCNKKMTLDKLKAKYNLTLYQVRELRKIHDLKAKRKK
jgi:uncharacterized protein (DUF433 family)